MISRQNNCRVKKEKEKKIVHFAHYTKHGTREVINQLYGEQQGNSNISKINDFVR